MFEDINATTRLVRSQSLPFTTTKELWQSDNGERLFNIFHYLDPKLIMQMSILFTCNSFFVDNCGRYSCDLSDKTK